MTEPRASAEDGQKHAPRCMTDDEQLPCELADKGGCDGDKQDTKCNDAGNLAADGHAQSADSRSPMDSNDQSSPNGHDTTTAGTSSDVGKGNETTYHLGVKDASLPSGSGEDSLGSEVNLADLGNGEGTSNKAIDANQAPPLGSPPPLDEDVEMLDSRATTPTGFDDLTGDFHRNDLLPRIAGCYRLLDLCSDMGSDGLVDKVIVSQDSLHEFIETLLPGACKSITKIDFSGLDRIRFKAVGLYGSKPELVRFLRQKGAINEETATFLRLPGEARKPTEPSLRSGLYLLVPPGTHIDPSAESPPVFYIFYWPEDATWDDSAAGTRRNRVTFMRYLTKLTDQVYALVCSEHSDALVLRRSGGEIDEDQSLGQAEDSDSDDDASGRLFKYKVAISQEQEESARLHRGFEFQHRDIGSNIMAVSGDTRPGFVFLRSIAAVEDKQAFEWRRNAVHFASLLKDNKFLLADTIDPCAMDIMFAEGQLRRKFANLQEAYHRDLADIRDRHTLLAEQQLSMASQEIEANAPLLKTYVRGSILQKLEGMRSIVGFSSRISVEVSSSDSNAASEYYASLCATYREIPSIYSRTVDRLKFNSIPDSDFQRVKHRFLAVRKTIHNDSLPNEQKMDLVRAIPSDADLSSLTSHHKPRESQSVLRTISQWFSPQPKGAAPSKKAVQMDPADSTLSDLDFLKLCLSQDDTLFAEVASEIRDKALTWASKEVKAATDEVVAKIKAEQMRLLHEQQALIAEAEKDRMEHFAFLEFRARVQSALVPVGCSPEMLLSRVWKSGREIMLSGFSNRKFDAELEARVFPLELTDHDNQSFNANPHHVAQPRLQRGIRYTLSPSFTIRHIRLLHSDRILVIANCDDTTYVWLQSRLKSLQEQPTKKLQIPRDYVVAVDEKSRLIAFIMMRRDRYIMNVYILDEGFTTLTGRGTSIDLSRWYQPSPRLVAAVFFPGQEEVCLVEDSGRARIYSFLSRGFRPSSIQLPSTFESVHAAPDASALLVIGTASESARQVSVYHRSSFGTSNGIVLDLPPSFIHATSFSATSLGPRNVSIWAIVPSSHTIISTSVQISRQETEYQFRALAYEKVASNVIDTKHNSLIDCFSEVWSKFPVIPAIKRETLSSEGRQTEVVTFVSDEPDRPFARYFKDMIRDFEKQTRKPTGQRLEQMVVRSASFHDLIWDDVACSIFKAGEWLVELICLVPIAIAVARDNQFQPLKDGVLDPQVEEQLLGAEVSKIIDSLTIGWYESIFNSYMAKKPVKVVSSMGEQSVGKSYSLNHLVDSSFAGSAVRTTEGVWLSVCPTKDALIVALDFEGVHSIERTPQEDMLLVLFNTALSNMVIFRNNFVFSRDVANMFTSFQASTRIFDPASNPKLFKGLLAVVIKDVVDSDKKEIVQEFESKFSQIVNREQSANFLTRLHNGDANVVPWSVIESQEFYTLFKKLSKWLMKRDPTHTTAGEFLTTMKTLMAKLKAQDWGALDQTIVKHRVSLLSRMLCSALGTGLAETDPTPEVLKNLENQDIIPHTDSDTLFYLGTDPQERQNLLTRLCDSWRADAARHDTQCLTEYLDHLVSDRLDHVKAWLDSNLVRFQPGNPDLQGLRREYEELSEVLRSSIRLCLTRCSSCRLQCLLVKAHDCDVHDCGTNHQCQENCDFLSKHEDSAKPGGCGLQAGHEGRHLCLETTHVCGQACALSDRPGCQIGCTKPIDHHDDEHACSAGLHQCGEPCDLRLVRRSQGGELYSCRSLCTYPHDLSHTRHSCDDRMSCPIRCELCQRFCTLGDHFHSLDPADPGVHLCGQEHRCKQQCELSGVCQVNTTPMSVESTFVGRHERFQYTKYTQVATRLPCAVIIAPGQREHDGSHVHSTENDFHFCETQCLNCGYFCNLPLGHNQDVHETAHGSMENTSWVVEGGDETFVELNGRKFANQDGGAPQLCHLLCSNLKRHAHIDYCRNSSGPCQEPETEHIDARMQPYPDRPKDWISHRAFWARTGFRDPYSAQERAEFAQCDAQCGGPEHKTQQEGAGPSFCTLPIFHPPHLVGWSEGTGSHVSDDGHAFACPHPNSVRQAFHVIFVLDVSSSMGNWDRQPLRDTPSFPLVSQHNLNRFGAVLSALHGFWTSREPTGAGETRYDAYSVILFNSQAQTWISNDTTSCPDALLGQIVQATPSFGTDFDASLRHTLSVMEANWSPERSPVVIFLSDGECCVSDEAIYGLCDAAVARQKPLSLHAVSFGIERRSHSLRRMVEIADEVATAAPRELNAPPVTASYSDAIDTIRLADTFLKIANALKKPRAHLIRS